ncbi:MAG: SUMF1/EgtB/PvdO family nonheme iron enzyme [bacterium]|nr:SUMF1/EgtB/PvdO family nonheme iron enzyme [bacterium]
MKSRGLFLSMLLTVFLAPGLLQAQTAADADFNGNGTVDFSDFVLFAQAYNSTQTRYDLNGNGTVDFSDFILFARAYGQRAGQEDNSLTVTLSGSTTMDLVYVQPGTFTMGSPGSEPGRDSDEGPQHEVTISQGFHLGKYEVTQGQWQAVMGTTPWGGQSSVQSNANHPAAYVSWNDAQAFIHKLNVAAGDSLYRLPTEAEWEYACRARTTTRWSFGDDESQLKDYAWYYDNAWAIVEQYGHEVGTKKANLWGLHDMHGNVWEWCQDWYGSYSSSAQVDPMGPVSGLARVVRGGGFYHLALFTRSAYRISASPSFPPSPHLGFRLLRRAK